MLVGATGTGKSTLVDGLVNYVLGVSFDDPFRFSLVSLEKEEKAHMNNQAVSQTDWITVYSILPDEGSKLSYKLNIIDTPGFGDTRGIERDNKIVQQIKGLFSADGRKGVMLIDAVCFMTKAPDARLTATQKYVFSSIAALFGKDIIKNICTLITFADGKQPPVLAALNESKLPYGHWFPFNNSALQADNEGEGMSDLSPIFWEMGCKSFGKFFEQLNKFETKSLQMTKDVLQERHNLQSIIQNLKPQVDAGLSKLHEIRTELKILEQHKTDIESNKDFQYEVDETKQIQKELKIGQHVTNCLHCNMTCHDDCVYADDNDKARCSSMNKEGKCKICTSKCHWTMHKNVPYIFEYVTEKVKKTYKEKLKKYEEASGKKLNHETVVNKMAEELDYLQLVIQDMMNNVNRCNNRLKEIALHPDPLTMKDHIDLMIEGEKQEKRIGWEGRIKMLQNMRQNANIEMDVDQLSKEMELAKSQIESSTGKPSERKEGYISRKLAAFKNFFA
ncbi:hypothetical protein FSP39_000543 [Pinctada imbricata]|uniref:Septin-type G domain-containing protein n=1 Tax=Pinctada imbricata TaxID=66713 RepID=A0AA88Y1W3_PINIB|nr:hypothetical protein FSP39_000543 [Pinctada imbricata]